MSRSNVLQVFLGLLLIMSTVFAYPQPDNPSVYWRETLATYGRAAFNTDSSYTVFRNVKNYGAVGNGINDDTAAIQAALNAGNGRTSTTSTTVAPAVVYLPPGTYLITKSLILPYYTQLIGSPKQSSTLKVSSSWSGWLIDADPYYSPNLAVGSTNNFYKEIRNIVFDMTASTQGAAIHWPTAQACQLQSLLIYLNSSPQTQQVGIFIESGSGGFMSDISIAGGLMGLQVGNQQFEVRNLNFYSCQTAISQLWSWTFLYMGLSINNCGVGIAINSPNGQQQTVGSITVLDSTFNNVNTGILTSTTSSSQPPTSGSLIIDNTQFTNTPSAVVSSINGAVLLNAGSSTLVTLWGQGHVYANTGTSPAFAQGYLSPPGKNGALLSGGKFVVRSRPDYAQYSSNLFASVRAYGASGDGVTDSTSTLQNILNSLCGSRIIFFDAGTYIVTSTLFIPAGCWIVGEGESVIMARGSYFQNYKAPQVVVRVGNAGDSATTQISGMLLSSTGGTAGAIMLEWNIVDNGASGIWSTHVRLGGARGTQQLANCPTNYDPNTASSCAGAFMMLRIRGSGYFENIWAWTADHRLDDDPAQSQINIFTGRGISLEASGPTWFHAVASEHATLYQYQFTTSAPIFAGLLQSETQYGQPNPPSPSPFGTVAGYNDPTGYTSGLGLRILNSGSITIYGAGLYSFFSNYGQSCIQSRTCQSSIASIENSKVVIFNLNTIGTGSMLNVNGASIIRGADNANVYPDTVVFYNGQNLPTGSTRPVITTRRPPIATRAPS